MTPVFLFLLFLSLSAAPLTDGAPRDPSSDVSEKIRKANEGISTGLIYGDIKMSVMSNADSCTTSGCKWPKNGAFVEVPIAIDRRSYSRKQRAIIDDSLSAIEASTCIRFRRRKRESDYIQIFSGSGCWSYVGRQPGGQQLSLRSNGCLYKDIVQHEILHALGFHHEHCRSDRDDHVTILTDNIQSGTESNFVKLPTNNLGTPYDFNSVMQYSNYAFSKNGSPTIVAKSDPNLSFGYAAEMSANDIARVNKLYGC